MIHLKVSCLRTQVPRPGLCCSETPEFELGALNGSATTRPLEAVQILILTVDTLRVKQSELHYLTCRTSYSDIPIQTASSL